MSQREGEVVRTTVWSAGPGCHGGCGVLAHVKDGRLIKVEGDPNHPWNQGRLCPRCLALTQYVYHPDRLKYPLKRVGERGEGKWQRLSWDEAFDIIEKKLNDIKEKHGPESVIFLQGTGRDVIEWLYLLAWSYGSPNRVFGLSGVACYTPRLLVNWVTHGDYCVVDAAQWLPKRYDDPNYIVPECIVVWGQSLPATCPDGFFGHWIVDLMKRGSKLIVIDPRFTWLASRAKVWLQIRPGTDGALALGFLNVIINEDLYDKGFVEKWTNASFLVRVDTTELLRECEVVEGGYRDRFVVWDSSSNEPKSWDAAAMEYSSPNVKPVLEGLFKVTLTDGKPVECKTVWTMLKERVDEYTPEKVAEVTWIPQQKIVEAARFYAKSKPAAVHWGVPVEAVAAATPTIQAITHLWCITGNLDIPGGNVIARDAFNVSGYSATAGIIALPHEADKKRIGASKYGPMRDFRRSAHPDTVLEQIFTEKPYPIKGMWIQASNPIAGIGLDPKKWYKALKKLDFVVVVDLFMTPTAVLADLVLPAATFLEKYSFRGWWIPLQAIKKVITVEECKSDIEINFELAKRFNPKLPWRNIKEMFNDILKPSGMTYDELCEKVWVSPPAGHSSLPYRRHEKGLLRQDGKPGFSTPSGKIELYSSRLQRWGLDPLPYYEEPPFSPVSTPDLYAKYPLILTTGRRSSVYFHSEHRMIPWLREVEPDPLIEIHPETAKQLAIKDGDSVWVENWLGKCRRKAKVTPIAHPKIVMVTHGWWFPEKPGPEPSLFGVWEVNINQLIPMGYTGKSGHGSPFKNMLCKVYKAE